MDCTTTFGEEKMRILIADSHTLFREGLRSQIQRFDTVRELQEVTRFDTLATLTSRPAPFDVVFIDKDLLGSDWKSRFKEAAAMFPRARMIMMSESEDFKDISESYDLGASGYITKLSPDSQTINALRSIMDGHSYVPPALLKGLQSSVKAAESGRILSSTLPNGKNLTTRQKEVLQHLSNGLSNKQIAYEMGVSEATVKLHINALLRHLHVENRTKAVVTAQRLGILSA